MFNFTKRFCLIASLFLLLEATYSQSANCSQLTQGYSYDTQISAYIEPGTVVSWSLYLNTFNFGGGTYTRATAQIYEYINGSVYSWGGAYLTDVNYGSYHESIKTKSGSEYFSNGGNLLLDCDCTVPNNASGARARITISW